MCREPSLTEPSIYYSLNSVSSLSLQSLGHSIETPALQTPSDDRDLPSPGLPPLSLVEIEAECQREPGRELIDRLDVARYSGFRTFLPVLRTLQMLDHMVCDEDRHKLLNILCKTCSRQRIIPKSMHVDERLNGELIEECNGGHATVFRTEHNGRAVAVKTARIYLTSDFDKCLSVSVAHTLHKSLLTAAFIGILSRSCCVEASPTPEHPSVAQC